MYRHHRIQHHKQNRKEIKRVSYDRIPAGTCECTGRPARQPDKFTGTGLCEAGNKNHDNYQLQEIE